MTAPLHEKHLSPRAGKAHSSALQAHLPGPGVLRTYGWFFFHNLNGKADDTFSPGKYRPFPTHTRLAKIRFFSPPAFTKAHAVHPLRKNVHVPHAALPSLASTRIPETAFPAMFLHFPHRGSGTLYRKIVFFVRNSGRISTATVRHADIPSPSRSTPPRQQRQKQWHQNNLFLQ